jgi:YidC/Oxa1 family membrane protein insertase
MYQAIVRTLAVTPLSLLELGSHVYGFLPNISSLVPINSQFLIWDLGQPDSYFIIPIVVVVSTYFSNKLMTPPTADPQMRQTNQMMQLMMPLMFGFFMLSTPVGLGVYWIASNLVGILQYYVTKPSLDRAKALHATPVAGAPAGTNPAVATAAAKPLFEPPKSKVKVKSTGRVNRSSPVQDKSANASKKN